MHTNPKTPHEPGPTITSSGTNSDGSALISGRTVQGTSVYSPGGDDLGHIEDVRIDPGNGRVVYGVLEFGGFLGIGSDHYPIPFERLKYDSARGGYVTDLTKEQLENAPRHGDDWHEDRAWQERAHKHYGVRPYWM